MPPKPRGHNASVYLILCSRRIRNLAVGNPAEHVKRIVNASDAAAEVVKQLELLYPKGTLETAALTELQHAMMDGLLTMTPEQADAMVTQMFILLDAVEGSLEGHDY